RGDRSAPRLDGRARPRRGAWRIADIDDARCSACIGYLARRTLQPAAHRVRRWLALRRNVALLRLQRHAGAAIGIRYRAACAADALGRIARVADEGRAHGAAIARHVWPRLARLAHAATGAVAVVDRLLARTAEDIDDFGGLGQRVLAAVSDERPRR